MNGIEVEQEIDIQIDLNVSSYIPDRYISDSKQKIEVYQNIALCKNEKAIEELIDELIDRFGNMPVQLENLIEIARIKYLAKENNIIKITSKKQLLKNKISTKQYITFTFENNDIKVDITKVVKKYGNLVRFNTVLNPQVIFELNATNEKNSLKQIIEFLKNLK